MREAIELLTLINALSPVGVGLVKLLATRLQGKTDEELKQLGDSIDDAIIATAKKELGEL